MTENELSTIIIGEAIHVHRSLGPGLLESVYETCLAHRLVQGGLRVEIQKPIPLVFEGIRMECGFRCDMLVDGRVIVEVKAVEALNDVHLAQVLTYLKLTDTRLGLLLNFNVTRLADGVRRVVHKL